MDSPIKTRNDAALTTPEGFLAGSPATRFVKMLGEHGAPEAYEEWRSGRISKAVIAFIRHLAMTQPAPASADTALVQYGITTGLSLAAQILEDPSAVYPFIFNESKKAEPVTESYSTSTDEALDESL